MKPKTLAGALAALCVAAAGLLYASPYIALHQIGKAVERRDAQALSGYVDFPALRESIKGQMMARLQSQMGGSGDSASNPWPALASNWPRAWSASSPRRWSRPTASCSCWKKASPANPRTWPPQAWAWTPRAGRRARTTPWSTRAGQGLRAPARRAGRLRLQARRPDGMEAGGRENGLTGAGLRPSPRRFIPGAVPSSHGACPAAAHGHRPPAACRSPGLR